MPTERGSEDLAWKLVFGCVCEGLGIPLETEKEVGKLARTINGVVPCDPENLATVAPLSPFPNLTEFNSLEGKGINDRLTVPGYHLIQARLRLYAAELGLEDCSRLSLYICCSSKPVRLLRRLPQLVKFERIAPGIYRADEKFPVYVLVATELPLEPRNYPLLLMGKEEQRRNVIRVWMQEGRERELTLAAELFPGTVREVMKMAGKRREPIDIEANLRYIADWLGPEPLLAGLSPQERMAGLSPQERLADLSPQERLADLSPQERLADLSPEELWKALGEEERRRLRELVLQEATAAPRSRQQGKSGTSRRANSKRRG